jgi:hypothetical protein
VNVNAHGWEFVAQRRELRRHDRAVGVVDWPAVDVQVQAVTAADLEVEVRVVRVRSSEKCRQSGIEGKCRRRNRDGFRSVDEAAVVEVLDPSFGGGVHGHGAVQLGLLEVVGDEGFEGGVAVFLEFAFD